MIKPLEILTDNLLNSKPCSLVFDSGPGYQSVQITFEAAQQADVLIIKNTDASAAEVYKTEGGEDILITTVSSLALGNLILRFPQTQTAQVFKIVLTGQASPFTSFCLCKSLIVLNNVLTSLKRNDFKREGHHYLADGSLIKWNEMLKFGCILSLKNLDKTTKNNLFKILKENSFMTFIFYGEFDTDSIYHLTLQTAPEELFDRKTALYEADIYLLEK